MKTERASAANQWRGIGKRAARRGLFLDDVLTLNESVNRLIREGYEIGRRRSKKKTDGKPGPN